MAIGRVEALIYLGLQDQDWGPAYMDDYDHATFAAYWRGEKPCPTEQEILDAIAALEAAAGEDAEGGP